jgi:hypothetical protein
MAHIIVDDLMTRFGQSVAVEDRSFTVAAGVCLSEHLDRPARRGGNRGHAPRPTMAVSHGRTHQGVVGAPPAADATTECRRQRGDVPADTIRARRRVVRPDARMTA